MDETEGSGCPGHSNWANCRLLSHFCSPNFPIFSLSCWEANSYYPRGLILRKGNSPNFRNGWDRGVWVPGAFKLDNLQPVKPLLFPQFSNFFTFILERPILITPERGRLKMGKWKSPNPRERHQFFSAWGIQTGPFAACCSPNFPTVSLLYWGPILITPEC